MIVSYNILQDFFDDKLPDPKKLADILTMHSYEVESFKEHDNDFIFEIDILPNRAHDSLSHRGVAKELSVLLNFKLKDKNEKIQFKTQNTKNKLIIKVEDEKLCRRYIGRIFENIEVKPSPDWLVKKLESIGQKSINNIVDATNFIMFYEGQPLHAFDLDKLKNKSDSIEINIRRAKNGEKITTLDKQEVKLSDDILVISDENNPLAIAGIKGGNIAEVDEHTKNIVLESANFEPTNIRLTSRKIGIRTDSSQRFEGSLSPALAGIGIDEVSKLILNIAGSNKTKIGEKVDFYPREFGTYKVGVSLYRINKVLGIEMKEDKLISIFKKLGFEYEKVNSIKKVLDIAPSLLKTPYKYGASVLHDAPKLFDCSSFMAYLFVQGGVSIPRMSVDQYFYGSEVKKEDIKPGDIIFSNTGEGKSFDKSIEFMPGFKVKEGIDHNGLYLGDGKVIHASRYNGDGQVEIENLDESKLFKNIIGIRRMVDNSEDKFVISVPVERLDIRIEEDLIEEVGRIYGYENIIGKLPSVLDINPPLNKEFFYKDVIKDILVDSGFSEIYTYSFVENGNKKEHVELLNPLANNKSFLRHNLSDEFLYKLDSNAYNGELLNIDKVKIFEIGKVFNKKLAESPAVSEEKTILGIGIRHLSRKAKPKDAESPAVSGEKKELIQILEKIFSELKISYEIEEDKITVSGNEVGKISDSIIEIDLDTIFGFIKKDFELKYIYDKALDIKYKKISKYPFISRDISLFVSPETEDLEVLKIIKENSGNMLANVYLFDTFEKDGKKSLAFRVVFQSYEKTLEDNEVNEVVDKLHKKLEEKGWQIR